MIIILSLSILVLTVVMWVKKQRVGLIICAVLLVLLSITNAVSFFVRSPAATSMHFVENERIVMTSVLAEELVARHPGKRFAVVVPPTSGPTPLEGGTPSDVPKRLKAALIDRDASVEIVRCPAAILKGPVNPVDDDLPPEEVDVPLFALVQMGIGSSQLNAILRHLEDRADVVICTLNLYSGFSPQQLLRSGKAPDLVLMQLPITAEPTLEKALQATVLDTVLMYKPNISWDVSQTGPKNQREAFDQRYQLVTAEHPLTDKK